MSDFDFKSMDDVRRVMGDKQSITLKNMCHTKIVRHGDRYQVYYHTTPVVTYFESHIELRSGGWHTLTTTRRINQFAPCGAFRYKGEIWVCPPNEWEKAVPLHEGMRISWQGAPLDRLERTRLFGEEE